MKTLGKLKLKEEKMLKAEELLGFRGGSGGGSCPTTSTTCWMCKQGAMYDCQYLGGYTPGTYLFNQCIQEGYVGCCSMAC